MSVLLKQEHRPLTAQMLGIEVLREKEPQNIVMDGAILDVPLEKSGFTKDKLDKELGKYGVSIEDVFLAQVDSNGKLYLDLHDEKASFK